MIIDFSKYPLPSRNRHHTSPNFYLKISELKGEQENYPPLYEKINWSEIFDNSKPPDLLDVGCGKGKLLLEQSQSHPNKNILGIEVRAWAVNWLKRIINGEKISNCNVIWYSVVNGLGFIENNAIEEIYYLFPDPWPKKKHQKRRAFTSELLTEFIRILKPNGTLFLSTDMVEVHDYHLDILKAADSIKFQIISDDNDWNLPITNKERFCRHKNIEFYRIKVNKL